jgi:hypothetical protein
LVAPPAPFSLSLLPPSLSRAGFPLFESESLRYPGFVEFDDVNGKVLTYSAAGQSSIQKKNPEIQKSSHFLSCWSVLVSLNDYPQLN